MNITLLCIGKTSEKHVAEGIRIYCERIIRYVKFSLIEINAGQGDEIKIRKEESMTLLKKIADKDFLILMDEKGKDFTSIEFSNFLLNHQNISTKHIVFVIGGAYGFSEEVYSRANAKIAVSKMTFPHQLVRVIFLEQLYRAFTILRGEKYHH